ncbi:MAG: hypothetical protein NVS2B8_19490 [Vulcanimicrobiaceae bacterium]
MTDIFKPINDDRNGTTGVTVNPYTPEPANAAPSTDAGKTLLAGALGGVLSAVGYLVYSRLPDDQKERLQSQARALVESRMNELRGRFNL